MTYSAFEGSVEAGRPVEVFEINAGTTTFFYTSSEDPHTLSADTYTPVEGLKRSSRVEGPDKRENDFKFEIPTIDPLAQLFTGQLPGFRVRLRIRRFHRDDLPTPEVVEIFDGFIQSASFKKKGRLCILYARTVIAAIGKTIPRRTYQSACNHVLYESSTCKVDDTLPAYRASTLPVSSQVANVLTVSTGISGLYPDGFMNGGYCEVVGLADYRTILVQTGNVLELMSAFSVQPSVVHAFAGCGHDGADCSAKFDNVINYGGFAFVPTKNPFQTGL